MAASLVWRCIFPQTYFGFFLELWFHFGIGAVVYYRLCVITAPRIRMLIDGLIVGCTVGAAIIWGLTAGTNAPVANCAMGLTVVSAFSLFLIVTRRLDGVMKWRLFRPLMLLGLISYSLYLTHQFNMNVAQSVAQKIAHGYVVPNAIIQLATYIGIAAIFWYFCERPFLNRPLRGPAVEAPSAPKEPATQPAPASGSQA